MLKSRAIVRGHIGEAAVPETGECGPCLVFALCPGIHPTTEDMQMTSKSERIEIKLRFEKYLIFFVLLE
jgi:hypothetical protein